MNSVWVHTIIKQAGVFSWLIEWVLWLLTSKWTLQLLWLVPMIWAWYRTTQVLDSMFPGLNPLLLYRWPFDVLQSILEFAGRSIRRVCNFAMCLISSIQYGYDRVLVMPTRFCAGMGLLGDLVLTPIALVWMFWPLHVPFHAGQLSLLFSAAPIACYLCGRGYKLIQVHFKANRSRR